MTLTRIHRSARLFRLACNAWLLALITLEIAARRSADNPLHRRAFWELSCGTLALLWLTLALWADGYRFRGRGAPARTVTRAAAPTKYWLNIAFVAALSVGLLLSGWRSLGSP